MATSSTTTKESAAGTTPPVTVSSSRTTATTDVADNTLGVADVKTDQGAQIIAINAADGRPVVIDPSYTATGDPTAQARATAAAVAADDKATEAERTTGERTVTARDTSGPVDAALVGMAGGTEMRPRAVVRVLRMDRAFKVGSDSGAAGDYLVQLPSGDRLKATAAVVEATFVAT
jgi:hypothetical protein